jgi:hypothetical protein
MKKNFIEAVTTAGSLPPMPVFIDAGRIISLMPRARGVDGTGRYWLATLDNGMTFNLATEAACELLDSRIASRYFKASRGKTAPKIPAETSAETCGDMA